MNFRKTDNAAIINRLRAELYQVLSAPIDAMWEQLYVSQSQHYLIEHDDETVGYCCVNDEKCLLQLYVLDAYRSNMEQILKTMIDKGLVTSSSLSSSEPISFNACLSSSKNIVVNTLCFQHSNNAMDIDSTLKLEPVTNDEIATVKAFLKEQVGMDDTFGYTENLVSRKEIFMVRNADAIIATSECRMSDSQPEIADLGIIVNKDYHGRGIATELMQLQVNRVLKANRKPICSTTSDNVASKRAIEKAGFYCSNIIFDIHFN